MPPRGYAGRKATYWWKADFYFHAYPAIREKINY